MPARTPTKILELRGTFKKNPQRKRSEPKNLSDLGDPPQHLGGATLSAWNELVASSPPGVLTASDRQILEICAVLLAQFREDPASFIPARLAQLNRALSMLGRTPVDRSRIGVNEQPQDNPWASFASEG